MEIAALHEWNVGQTGRLIIAGRLGTTEQLFRLLEQDAGFAAPAGEAPATQPSTRPAPP